MTSEKLDCQNQTWVDASLPISTAVLIAKRVQWYWADHGFLATCQKAWSVSMQKIRKSAASPKIGTRSERQTSFVPLNLQPGELVEVKSESELRESLDGDCSAGGLMLMPAMLTYCGKKLRVFRRVNQIVIENGGGMRKLKHTVLLEGAFCPGITEACDRSCFFFWREAWLRRVTPTEQDPLPPDSPQ